MKITVEMPLSVLTGSCGGSFGKEVYLNSKFMGCIGFNKALEFEAKQGENEFKLIDCKKSTDVAIIRFTATENVYFWIMECTSARNSFNTKIYGKGEDYKLISESKE